MVSFEDLWMPAEPLPTRRTLEAMVRRIAAVWGWADRAAGVRIVYNPRLRVTLGRACLEENRVELNTRLLREHPDQLPATLVHELAHLVVHDRFGRVPPHGRQFASLMRQAGADPSATHDLPVGHLRRKRGKFLYLHRCEDCGYSFIARSVKRNYYCRACGPDMTWYILRAPNTTAGRRALKAAQAKLSCTGLQRVLWQGRFAGGTPGRGGHAALPPPKGSAGC